MAKCKKGCGSCKMCGCEECDCKKRPKMLMALLLGLAVLVLVPGTEANVAKNVMSSVVLAEEIAEDGENINLDEGTEIVAIDVAEDFTDNFMNTVMGAWKNVK